MGKEKNYNPVQAAKKAEKQKQLKKQKANLQAQRNEKLARRNPARLQRDIDELKAREQSGDIRPHDRQRLAQLEKDVAAIRKARETLGDNAPQFGRERGNEGGDRGGSGRGRGRGGGILGKRRRDGGWKGRDGEESSETDEDVKDIPMPRDTPPPIPRWHRNTHPGDSIEAPPESKKPTIVYEAAPEVRDLRKEATKFMPAAVQQKMRLVRGEVEGRLLEPEELDKLEKEGYMAAEKAEAEHGMMTAEASGEMKNLESEGAQTERKLRHVEIEEVEDEDW
ncbi:hypothetical protein K469DRAFT_677638 [Zopfia rhizophila CBS 207.26]|uniref:Wbp11/ELF5/Saf1 N-terminal domain-containing protein n=1 Tax=Zopfia rhizophila CBS 207.26 TaxID=1314779 RepID=A0A6A6DFN3_9PEZI|nr:hypothetical protein K469DRAFT_677638 [Zopfia rhizophila CBS 207.26]